LSPATLSLVSQAGEFIKLVWDFRVVSLNVLASEFIYLFIYLFAGHKGHRSPLESRIYIDIPRHLIDISNGVLG
jgi:hypothetical protein